MKIHVDRWLARHHGVISRAKAQDLGLPRTQIDGLVRSGRWRQVHHGVYQLVGTPWDALARLEAALAVAGPAAVASHASAAWLFGLLPSPPPEPIVAVTRDRRPRAAGIRVIRTRHPPRPVTVQGFPCTEIIRTIVDCAGEMTAAEIDSLVDAAVARRLTRIDAIIAAATGRRFPTARGRAMLQWRLAQRGVTGSPHPSVLESLMARLLKRHGLPVPRAEVRWQQGRYRLDFAYPELKLAIEVDGWTAHFSPEQQRYDLTRRNTLMRSGWTVLHYTWWDVTREPDRVAAEISDVYRRLAAA